MVSPNGDAVTVLCLRVHSSAILGPARHLHFPKVTAQPNPNHRSGMNSNVPSSGMFFINVLRSCRNHSFIIQLPV